MEPQQNPAHNPAYQKLLSLHAGIILSAHNRRRQSIGDTWCAEQVLLSSLRTNCQSVFSQNPLSTLAKFRTHSYPSVTPVGQLKWMGVGELRVENKHSGRCLVVRSVEIPKVMLGQGAAVAVVAEDESGSRVPVRVYYPDAVRGVSADMPVGWVFMVKEPFYKVMDDGTCAVRVDHVSDVVPMGEIDERMIPAQWRVKVAEEENTVSSWAAKGNKAFKAENDRDAIFRFEISL